MEKVLRYNWVKWWVKVALSIKGENVAMNNTTLNLNATKGLMTSDRSESHKKLVKSQSSRFK